MFKQKQLFSLRKLKLGLASVMIGSALLPGAAFADDIKIDYVSIEELSEQDKTRIEKELPKGDYDHYYLVYQPKKGPLPATGDNMSILFGALGISAVLISVAVVGKRKSIAGVALLLATGAVLTVPTNALEVSIFKHMSTVIAEGTDVTKSKVAIDGYEFVGYIVEKSEKVASTTSTSATTAVSTQSSKPSDAVAVTKTVLKQDEPKTTVATKTLVNEPVTTKVSTATKKDEPKTTKAVTTKRDEPKTTVTTKTTKVETKAPTTAVSTRISTTIQATEAPTTKATTLKQEDPTTKVDLPTTTKPVELPTTNVELPTTTVTEPSTTVSEQPSTTVTEPTTTVAVDKSLLETELTAKDTLDEPTFTKASWSAYADEWNKAKAVFDDPAATQEQVDAATDALKQARAKLELLKTKPIVEWVDLTKVDAPQEVTFNLKATDLDSALKDMVIDVVDPDGNVVKTVDITAFYKGTHSDLKHNVKYKAVPRFTYDLGDGPVEEQLEPKEFEFLSPKKLEFHSITGVSLMQHKDGTTSSVNGLISKPDDLNSYFMKLSSDEMKDVLLPVTNIEEVDKDGDQVFKVTVEFPELVQDNDPSKTSDYKDQFTFFVPKQKQYNDPEVYTDFSKLIKDMNANPGGTFKIGSNLSAKGVKPSPGALALVDSTFTGQLIGAVDGKAYAIDDLEHPLFLQLNGTVTDLNIRDAKVNDNSHRAGILAKDANGASVTNVAITGEVTGTRTVGGMVGKAINSTFNDVSFKGKVTATNTATGSENFVGGLVGRMEDSEVDKAYVNVIATATAMQANHKVGALTGSLYAKTTKTLQNILVEGEVNNLANFVAGGSGLVGSVYQHGILRNAVTRVKTTNGYQVNADPMHGNARIDRGTVFVDHAVATGTADKWTTPKTGNDITNLIDSMNLSATVDDSTLALKNTVPKVEFTKLDNASQDRGKTYENVAKFTPFYYKEYIVEAGNKIPTTHNLYNKQVVSVTPRVGDQLVSDVNTSLNAIDNVLVYYADNKVESLPVTRIQGEEIGLPEFKVDGLDLVYTPKQFISNYDTIVNAVVGDLQALDYHSTEMSDDLVKLLPHEITNEATKSKITEDEAREKLRVRALDRLYLKEKYNEVQQNLPTLLREVLSTDSSINISDGAIAQSKIDYIKKHKKQLLLGLSYVQRWYGYDVNGQDIGRLATFHQDFYGKPVSTLEWLVGIGASYDSLRPNNHMMTYGESFGPNNPHKDLISYFIGQRELFAPNMTDNEWFLNTTNAYVKEVKPEKNPGQLKNIFDRLSQSAEKSSILPLLTAREGVFIISNVNSVVYGWYDGYMDMNLANTDPAKYATEKVRVEGLIDRAANSMKAYYDFWRRILHEEVGNKLAKDIPTWSGYLDHAGKWKPMQGDTSNAINDFFGPVGRANIDYTPGLGGFANGDSVVMVVSKILYDSGLSVYSHEQVHNNDGIMLGGYGRREGARAEFFAYGLFQAIDSGPTNSYFALNSMFDYSSHVLKDEALHNLSFERFKNEEDLNRYMRGVFDVLYSLDILEANEVLKQPKEVKADWFRKLGNKITKDKNDRVNFAENTSARLSDDELNRLQNINDLVDNDIYTRRAMGDEGTFGRNGYHRVDLFSGLYGGLSTEGNPGDMMFRYRSFELLAEKGYNAGLVPYASNKLADKARAKGSMVWSGWFGRDVPLVTDSLVLEEVFGNTYQDWYEFKKDMYNRRDARIGDLKPVTITWKGQPLVLDSRDKYEQVFKEAVAMDAPNNLGSHGTNSNVKKLKRAIYIAFMKATDEHRQSVYKN